MPRPADRFGYCSVAGNTLPDGAPIAAGTFLNLVLGQPGFDPHYTGAYPSFYIEGVGITCNTPAGLASLQGRRCGLTPVATRRRTASTSTCQMCN